MDGEWGVSDLRVEHEGRDVEGEVDDDQELIPSDAERACVEAAVVVWFGVHEHRANFDAFCCGTPDDPEMAGSLPGEAPQLIEARHAVGSLQ
ncbi:MAG: hypothetical protein AAGD18_17400 [Actinomycetota bacterium]